MGQEIRVEDPSGLEVNDDDENQNDNKPPRESSRWYALIEHSSDGHTEIVETRYRKELEDLLNRQEKTIARVLKIIRGHAFNSDCRVVYEIGERAEAEARSSGV